MSWFKVDDGLPSSRKVLSIPRSLRCAAMGVWALGGAWCAKELTDGMLPKFMLDELGGTDEMAVALVSAGLWIEHDDEYEFHDWFDYQPSREGVIERRRKNAERLRLWREEKARRNDVTNDVTNGATNANERTPPSRPVPTRPDPLEESAKSRPDVEALCSLLADLIEANGSKRPKVTKGWRDSARLLLDRDERPLTEAKTVMRWSQGDDFWKSNVLSMPKFREKYDTLRLQSQRDQPKQAANDDNYWSNW